VRIESSVTALSWIPSEAVEGLPKIPFSVGLAHYDAPPPDRIDDIAGMAERDEFREGNELRAWIDVEEGRIIDYGYSGGGHIGVTKLKVGPTQLTVPAVQLPTIQREPETGPGWVRFTQSAGGRTGAPAPRHVHGKPYFQIASATAWTTLSLTIYADGRVEHELVGASSFPRHWLYDADGRLVAKSGVIDFERWYREQFGERTPWGDEDSAPVVTAVESELERRLSRELVPAAGKPRRLDAGEALVLQGEEGNDVYLLLDGMLAVEVDGSVVGEVGPGMFVGERALLEGNTRTATLRAATPAKVIVLAPEAVDESSLVELAGSHRREES
jgi:hypothetical protein